MYTVGVITSSDAGARGEREDSSGALIKQVLAAPDFEHRAYVIVPDDRALIERTLTSWADDDHLDLIVTTGGTGLTDRDVVPEATRAVVDRLAPGIAEAMRAAGVTKTPMAMLSRGIIIFGKSIDTCREREAPLRPLQHQQNAQPRAQNHATRHNL